MFEKKKERVRNDNIKSILIISIGLLIHVLVGELQTPVQVLSFERKRKKEMEAVHVL